MLNGHQAPGAVISLEMQVTPNFVSGEHWSPKGANLAVSWLQVRPGVRERAHGQHCQLSLRLCRRRIPATNTKGSGSSSIIGLMPALTVISTTARRNTEATTK